MRLKEKETITNPHMARYFLYFLIYNWIIRIYYVVNIFFLLPCVFIIVFFFLLILKILTLVRQATILFNVKKEEKKPAVASILYWKKAYNKKRKPHKRKNSKKKKSQAKKTFLNKGCWEGMKKLGRLDRYNTGWHGNKNVQYVMNIIKSRRKLFYPSL